MHPAVSVTELDVVFRGGFRRAPVRALHGLDLEVSGGRIVGILGPNGSGKTTLLRVLAGLQLPTAGTAAVLGLPPADRRLVRRVGFQPEGPLPFARLRAGEFLRYMGNLVGLPAAATRERSARWLRDLELEHAERRPIRTFSTGMQKRLALAAAMLAEPEVLLLDEPTSGLDPAGSHLVRQLLRQRAQRGTAIVLASHYLLEVEETCDEVAVLHRGRLRARGTLDELLGTGEQTLVVRGLDDAGVTAIEAKVQQAGGELVRRAPTREHLFALFRRLENLEGEGTDA